MFKAPSTEMKSYLSPCQTRLYTRANKHEVRACGVKGTLERQVPWHVRTYVLF